MLIVMSGFLFSACTKHEVYSVIPAIEYKSFEKIPSNTGADNKAYMTITFTDGDGDIGLNPEDTFPPYNPEENIITIFSSIITNCKAIAL